VHLLVWFVVSVTEGHFTAAILKRFQASSRFTLSKSVLDTSVFALFLNPVMSDSDSDIIICSGNENEQVPAAATPAGNEEGACSPPEPEDGLIDVEELHLTACHNNQSSYIDPATGFTCFTEVSHLRRGKCCGGMCRHCPYGYELVKFINPEDGTTFSRPAKCTSGDMKTAKRLLKELLINGNSNKTQEQNSDNGDNDNPLSDSNTNSSTDEAEDAAAAAEKAPSPIAGSGKGGRHGGAFTKKNVPYTRGGDKGTSMLLTGHRRKKNDLAFEAMGTVDEATSVLGLVYAELTEDESIYEYGPLPDWLLLVMSRLMDVGSHVAKPKSKPKPKLTNGEGTTSSGNGTQSAKGITSTKNKYDGVGGDFDPEHTVDLETWIDTMTEELSELDSFLLPTGGRAASQLHVARTVCRRAERLLVDLVDDEVCDPEVMRYLNRLSDFCFTAARYANGCEDRDEILYKRHFRSAKQRNIVLHKTKVTGEEKK
jgi:cob(I)alamin adenosyltransferase